MMARRNLNYLSVSRWIGALALVLACILFYRTFGWIAYEFKLPRNDLTHGWLVPFFSAYVVWSRRVELRRAVGKPDGRGLLAVLAGLALFWLGSRGGQMRFCQVALIWEVWAIPFALFGGRVARLMVFPTAFLLFTVPMGFLYSLTLRLRLVTAAFAAAVLNGIGISVVRTGTGLHSLAGEGFNLDVADPCSGLRSLFAMTALTAAYAFMTIRGRLRQWLLFFCAVPLAVIGNAARIFSIAWVARFFGAGVAVGFYHDYSGYVVFLVAVLLMIQLGNLIARVPQRRWEFFFNPAAGAPEPVAESTPPAWRDYVYAVAVPVAFACVLAVQTSLPAPTIDAGDFLAADLPEIVGGCQAKVPLFCHNEQCLYRAFRSEREADSGTGKCPKCGGDLYPLSLGEATILPADTEISKRSYTDGAGFEVEATLVMSGLSRMSIHRPELCLPSQGFTMSHARRQAISLPGRTPLVVQVVNVQKGGASFLLMYWFKSRTHETSSHTVRILRDAWARSVYNRINRWAMFAVTMNLPADSAQTGVAIQRVVADIYEGAQTKESDAHGHF